MRRIRALSFTSVLAVVVAGLSVVAMSTSPAAAATTGSGVSYDKAGCRNDGSIVLPDANGDFICPDAAYTSGNLGKGWNELDLVPFRAIVIAGNSAPATQTVTFVVAVDNMDAGHPGYDVLSAPVLNTAKSSASCPAATVGPEQYATPGMGGVDTTLYRVVTLGGLARNSTCVYDHYARLALGSHLFPGSALHWNLANDQLDTSGIGSKEISIPVNEILPQELDKDMTATQGSDHVWNVVKSPNPATVSFTNTCDNAASRSQAATVQVSWTKQAATSSGPITVVTHVYATNPAARVITISGSDQIYSGTTPLGSAASWGPTDVPANTANYLVLTHTTTVPAGTTDLNDIATATYTDKVTGVPVPGTTTATASAAVQPSGTELNQTATITDVESITGAGLSFSVDSVSGASGTFNGGYVAGTITTGPVSWTSSSQSGNGSVTFSKTIYTTTGSSVTGSLDDTATLTGSDGFTASANGTIAISATALVSLTINKTIPVVLDANDATQTFTFPVSGPGGYSSSPTISFGPGHGGSSDVHSTTLTGLAPGTYTVSETTLAPYAPQDSATATINLPTCSGSVRFNNHFGPASARVRKVTVPGGSEAGWVMTLNGPGAGATGESKTTTGTGYVSFDTPLQEGSYTITETAKAGWDQTAASSECSFTVDYPADADRVFSCTITNTQRGTIAIVKDAVPNDPQDFGYTTTGAGLSSFSLDDDADPTLSNTKVFTNVVPGSYSVTETPVTHWDLTALNCHSSNGSSTFSTDLATGVASIVLGPGDSVACLYRNTKQARVRVIKTENGGNPTHAYTFRLTGGPDNVSITKSTDPAAGTGAETLGFGYLKPGTYTLCELAVPAGTDSTLETAYGGVLDPTTGNVCLTFTLAPGVDRDFTIDNSHPLGGQRTIGYWKNWASCNPSGGNWAQRAARTGNHLMDEFLPKRLGPYLVDTCAKGLAVLNKSSGKYAENALAAQLLAAKLNVAAGASHSCIDSTISHADSLLNLIGYDGPAGDQVVGSTHPRRADFLATAHTLDQYNNGLLC